VPLSNTSATKSQPRYGAANRVYYLAAGKVIATDPATRDTDQLFPAFDAAKTAAPLLASGGIVAVQPAPDGKRLIMTMQMEKGQALLMYDIDNEACVLLGAASERVLFKFFPDGKLFTLFVGGAPLTKPVLLFGHDQISAGLPAMGPLLISAESDEQITLQVGEGNDPAATPRLRLPKANVAVQLSTAGAVAMEPIPVPFQPTSIALSPDGSLVVFGVEMPSLTPQGTLPPGLFVMSTTNKPAPGGKPILFTNPAREPSFSPDGKQIVFTSEKDIYVVPADGSAEAKPLTKGQGNSNQPAWSPAVVKK